MELSINEREKIILLVEQALKKVQGRESPDLSLENELTGILDKMSIADSDYSIPIAIPQEDMEYASSVIQNLTELTERYVKQIDVNDIYGLEEVKKEISAQLMYLSSYKDKFLYEIEFAEDTLKKDIATKMAIEIATELGISFTQAEKRVPADIRYINLKEQIKEAKIYMTTIKTKYDFFSKMIQVVVQSISVAGKEQYSTKVSN